MARINTTLALNEKLEEWRIRSFAYGDRDCCQFVADVAYALTGVDYRKLFPIYRTQAEAAEILAAHDGMVGLLAHAFGEPKPAAFAQRGEPVAVDFGYGLAAAICVGVYSVTPNPKGLGRARTLSAVAAWTI